MKFAIGEMTVGDIFDRSLRLLLTRFGTLYLISFLVLLPLLAFELASPLLIETYGLILGSFMQLPVLLLLGLFLQPLATGAILYVVEQEFIDRRVTVGAALGVAASRFWALLGTGILVGLVVNVGLIMCIVPGVLFAIWFAFASQTVVVEGLSGGEAMGRSKRLTEGHQGRVFGVLMLVVAIYAVGIAISFIVNSILPAMEIVPYQDRRIPDPFDPGIVVIHWTNHFINTIVQYLIQLVMGTFMSIATTLLYFDLRIRKEGYDLEVAAARGLDKPNFDFET
jgi:hypothetical protein